MILFYIFLLIPLITARTYDGPSYRSSVMEGDKPILRMPNEQSEYESDNDDRRPIPVHYKKSESMVRDVSLLINWLVENFGYDLVPQVRRRTDDTPDADADTEETTDADTPEAETAEAEPPPKKALREADTKTKKKHTTKKSKPAHSNEKKKSSKKVKSSVEKLKGDKKRLKKKSLQRTLIKSTTLSPLASPDPVWMSDLKFFIKDLITHFGQEDLNRYTKPVVAALEKKHHVRVTDIDVDQYGEILVDYIEKDRSRRGNKRY